MLRAHVAAAGAAGFAYGVFYDPLGPGGQPLGRGKPRQASAYDFNNGRPGPFPGDGLLQQAPVGRAALLPQKPQQKMLAADIAVAQLLRRRLGEPQGALRPGGKSIFIHDGPILQFTQFYLFSIPLPTAFTHFSRNG